MREIALLYDASQIVLSTFEMDEVLDQILKVARDYFHLTSASILLVDSRTNELYVGQHYGAVGFGESFRTAIGGRGLSGATAEAKQTIYAPDVTKDPRYVRTSRETRSELCLPLMMRDQLLGVLDFQSDKTDAFDEHTIDLLTLFSTQAAAGIANAKLYARERRYAAQLEAINAVARQTTAVLDPGELLSKVCSLILESFPIDHVAVLMEERGGARISAHHGRLTPCMMRGDRIEPGDGLVARVLQSGKTVVENDVSKAPQYIKGFEETVSEMCVPLIAFGKRLGVLALESNTADTFQSEDVTVLESVADICAAAIQNAQFFEQVKELAYVDGLTGIYNRRFFETRLQEEMERCRRHEKEMSLIMVDIDHFKKLNDEFGHLLGDEVLRQFYGIFSQQLRKSDVACRYGGEEFVILALETSRQKSVRVAEKLRKVVEGWLFPGVPRRVTISAGVADFPLHGETRDELVAAADASLYAAKQAGRNCVVSCAEVRKPAASTAPSPSE